MERWLSLSVLTGIANKLSSELNRQMQTRQGAAGGHISIKSSVMFFFHHKHFSPIQI